MASFQGKVSFLIFLRQTVVFHGEVKLLPSHRNWEIGVLSFLTIMFQRDGSQIFKRSVLGLENCKEAFRNIYISEGQRKDV